MSGRSGGGNRQNNDGQARNGIPEVVDAELEDSLRFTLVSDDADGTGTRACSFCRQKFTKDLLKGGSLYQNSKMAVHFFCLLFSEKGVQNSPDNVGLFGFPIWSIKAEIKRSKAHPCKFCSVQGASVKCSQQGCNARYHFSCGYLNRCLFQFKGQHKSYCDEHREGRVVRVQLVSQDEKTESCPVCMEDFATGGADKWNSPCCRKGLHLECIQKMALASGIISLRCPICNNKEDFIDAAKMSGIYVPHAESAWEQDAIFYDILSPNEEMRCEHVRCQRETQPSQEGTIWEVITCYDCGSNPVHIACVGLTLHNPDCYTCSDCINFNPLFNNPGAAESLSLLSPVGHGGNEGRSRGRRADRPALKRLEVRLPRLNPDNQPRRGLQVRQQRLNRGNQTSGVQVRQQRLNRGNQTSGVQVEMPCGRGRPRTTARRSLASRRNIARRRLKRRPDRKMCSLCPRTFQYRSSLVRHMVSAHKWRSRGHQAAVIDVATAAAEEDRDNGVVIVLDESETDDELPAEEIDASEFIDLLTDSDEDNDNGWRPIVVNVSGSLDANPDDNEGPTAAIRNLHDDDVIVLDATEYDYNDDSDVPPFIDAEVHPHEVNGPTTRNEHNNMVPSDRNQCPGCFARFPTTNDLYIHLVDVELLELLMRELTVPIEDIMDVHCTQPYCNYTGSRFQTARHLGKGHTNVFLKVMRRAFPEYPAERLMALCLDPIDPH